MNHSAELSRRRFVKTFTFGTAFSVFMGKPWRGRLLAGLQPLGDDTVGILRIKISDYPALQNDFGSVRLGINPIDGFLGPVGLFYPILINRAPGGQFHALNSSCTHAGCIVSIYDEGEGLMRCPCHGSGFALDGTVVAEPALSPLVRYVVTFDGMDTLSIQVPGLGYRVVVAAVPGEPTPRLQLDFPTFGAVEYEVLFRSQVADDWAVAPFALTPDAPTEQWSLIGDDLPASVYVERSTPAGFYRVAIKLLDLTQG